MVDADALADVVTQAIEIATAPLLARIVALEKRAPVSGRDGIDGKDAPIPDLNVIATKAAALIPRPVDGKDGRNGIDGAKGDPGEVGPVGPKGDPGERGADGKDGRDGIDGAVGPIGERGPEGPKGDTGDRGMVGEKGDRGEPGQVGERGLQGEKGLDGAPGRDGRDGLQGLPGEKGLDGKDGRDGIDGKDGLGIDNLEILHDGERTVTLKFAAGERVVEKAIRFPVQIHRGIYVPGKAYEAQDVVTYGGSQWHATADTKERPGDGATAWKLVVKKGLDGKDGKSVKGDPGPKGEKGDPGVRY